MPPRISLTKEQVQAAMAVTKSNRSAARYLNISYNTYKIYAKLYVNEDGITLYEAHLNRGGKGVPKFLKNEEDEYPLMDLITGKMDPYYCNPQKLKYKLIEAGHLREECYQCGFKERRVLDYKIPIILNFKDKNKNNWKLNNLEFLCHNCYFINIGDLFTDKVIKKLEDNVAHFTKEEVKDFELDEFQSKRLEELGLFGTTKPPVNKDDGSEFISRSNL